MERWVWTCHCELLNRTPDLEPGAPATRTARVRAVVQLHRPHQGIANARPLRALPSPITEPGAAIRLHVHRRDRLGGIIHEYQHAA
jgi:putative transposase